MRARRDLLRFPATAGSAFAGVRLSACSAGIYIGDTDDAPGAALIGIVLMIGLVALGMRMVWRRT